MAVRTVQQLKDEFAAGNYLTAAKFEDLIDSVFSGLTPACVEVDVDTTLDETNYAIGQIIVVTNNNQENSIEVTYNFNKYNDSPESSSVHIPAFGSATFVKKANGYLSFTGTAIQSSTPQSQAHIQQPGS
jgi:hypothetical protein